MTAAEADQKAKKKAYNKAYRQANRERLVAANKVYCDANREQRRATDRAYKEANREQINARNRTYTQMTKEQRRAYREANKEHIKAREKAYNEANKERRKAWEERSRGRKYGLTDQQYAELLRQSDGRCQCCKTAFSLCLRGSPHVDHCHKTGKVRGLLCGHCNLLLGCANDDPRILQACIRYLKAQKEVDGHADNRRSG